VVTQAYSVILPRHYYCLIVRIAIKTDCMPRATKNSATLCDCGAYSTVTISDHSRHGVSVNNDKLEPGENRELQPGDVVTLPFGMEYKFANITDGRARPLVPSLSDHSAHLHTRRISALAWPLVPSLSAVYTRRILLPGLATHSLAVRS